MAYKSRTAYAARPGTGRVMYSPPGRVQLNGLEGLEAVRKVSARRRSPYTFRGLGYPAFATRQVVAGQSMNGLGAVRRSPIGGRYRLRGLSDCAVIDPVTG